MRVDPVHAALKADEADPWPAFDDGSGCSWALMDWPSGVAVPP